MTKAGENIPDLVTVGGLTVDNVVAADGIVGLGQAGGNGAYAAVGALHFVDRVGLVSQAVATYPADVLSQLEKGGVDLGGVVFAPDRLAAGSWFLYAANGDRDERFHSAPQDLAAAGFPTDKLTASQRAEWTALLAARAVDPSQSYAHFRTRNPLHVAQVPDAFWRARGLHLAPSAPGVMIEMLNRAPPEMTVIADPGWQLAAHPLDTLAPILSRLNAFLPSEVELRKLVPNAGLTDGLAVLAAFCPGTVAVKLGPRGILVWNRAQGNSVQVAARSVVARDPTGAGDAFCGGFLAGLVETGDPLLAARFGAVAAARIVQYFGADGALPADQAAARHDLAQMPKEMVP
jgi:sugar/nucleoside kinase (ribokinase family)